MPEWIIQTRDGKNPRKCRCWGEAQSRAVQRAQQRKRNLAEALPELSDAELRERAAILVKYKGPRPKPPSRDARRSDFIQYPGGRRDHTVDPAWWANEKK